MKNNRILVIGGNGFIGKNIVNKLLNENYEPVIYDLYASNLNVEQHCGNLLEDPKFPNIVESCSKIIYLITSVSPKKSMDDPCSAYTIDIPLLIKTLNVCREKNINRLVYASSGGTIYGEGNGKLFREDDEKNPINHYAICKLSCEKILNLYNRLYNMENISLRISNPYGLGQNPSSGVGVITTFASEIINNNPLTLFGSGKNYRDYIDVESVAEAFKLALDWNFQRDIEPVFNIGSGEPLSLKDIIEIICSTYNVEPNISYLPERDFDLKYIALDTSKSEKYLQFQTPKNQEERIKNYIIQFKKMYEKRRNI